MTVYVNDAIRAPLAAGFDWSGKTVGLALLHNAAVPTAAALSVDQLVTGLGFQEVAAAGYARFTTPCSGVVTGTHTDVVVGEDFAPGLTEPVAVVAGVFYLIGSYFGATNPWLFMTDEMFGNVMTPGALIAVQGSPSVLFSYTTRGTIDIDMAVGQIVQSPGPLEWESARAQHVYLFPQRVNYAPNPSFEDVGNFGWRSDGVIARTVGGIDNPSNYFLRVSGTMLECIPVAPTERPWRCSAFVRKVAGTVCHLELGCWDETFTVSDPVRSRDFLLTDDWTRYDALLRPFDDTAGVSLRVVADGSFDVDLVLFENNHALHDYFDGDSTTSMLGDYSWQGVQHQSYSFWYNNKYKTGARLFGEYKEGQVGQDALIWTFIPTDTSVYTHWNVLDALDTAHPLKDWSSRIIPVTGPAACVLGGATASASGHTP